MSESEFSFIINVRDPPNIHSLTIHKRIYIVCKQRTEISYFKNESCSERIISFMFDFSANKRGKKLYSERMLSYSSSVKFNSILHAISIGLFLFGVIVRNFEKSISLYFRNQLFENEERFLEWMNNSWTMLILFINFDSYLLQIEFITQAQIEKNFPNKVLLILFSHSIHLNRIFLTKFWFWWIFHWIYDFVKVTGSTNISLL